MKPQKKIKNHTGGGNKVAFYGEAPNPQEKELIKSRKELKEGKGKELKGLSQLNNPQENWVEEFFHAFPLMSYDLEVKVKQFIRHLLSEEEANWMAEIHEQVKAERERVIKDIEKIILPRTEINTAWDRGYDVAKEDLDAIKKNIIKSLK